MAVTIHTTPKAWATSGNPLIYEFSSNQSGQANFSFVVETLYNGSKVREERVFPEVSGGKAHIDISETVDCLLNNPQIFSTFGNDSATSALISIRVIEYYGSPATAQGNATSSQTRAFKGSVSAEVFEDIDFDADWKLKKWLTNHPTKNISVMRNQMIIASMITGGTGTLTVTLYDANGAVLDSDTLAITQNILQVNLSNAGLLDTGFSQADIDASAYMTAQVNSSETITFTWIDDDCINPNSLLWLNEYGAYDTFCFTHNKIDKGQVTAKDFGKQYGGWNGTTYTFNPLNAGQTTYSTNRQTTGTLVSGYMTGEINAWLMELYDSPRVILYAPNGSAKAVNLLSRSYEVEQDKYEDLISEEVEYKLSNDKHSVRL